MGFFKNLFQDLQELWGPEPEPGPEDCRPAAGVTIYQGPKELLDAEARCPDVKFVQSCRDFYERRGFLSDRQREALKYAGTPNRRYNYHNGYDPEY